ncbi:hypothetical protein [Pseudoponticoccus marisrubri]|uniref:Cytochrome c domain-containing protein n=1 Tax=Pseudoponticoccus marisrubri TaxID=1685382 RepID=A0A0W7WFV0_9RHOB|nr:hypothetical protein [Pseudoponticoccus marisrubri]KUF09449.1 hypothetical protein AVJ23_17565 [Pseudoponticoccus marisrubri]
MRSIGNWPLVAAGLLLSAPPALAEEAREACMGEGAWSYMHEPLFASVCAEMAFGDSLRDRQRFAWMLFARVNFPISDPAGGFSGSGQVPNWMAWPTDPDTFDTARPFEFGAGPRAALRPSVEKKDLKAGRITTADPDGANEEVVRNRISYDYLVENGLTTRRGIAHFFDSHDAVDMPVGSIELKASWLQVTEGSPAPEGALTYRFEGGTYWWRGLHIMAKIRSLEVPGDIFYSEAPSWFWATFEFTDNPGARHVRDSLITQRAPLPQAEIAAILEAGGVAGMGLEAYAPNGTQIRFTAGGTGAEPVILGHTDMEDFAGGPNTAQPAYWTTFQSSCHACHATAAYNPETRAFFPFSVPTGALDPGYNKPDAKGVVQYLGQGYRPLDFMWPIAFQTK